VLRHALNALRAFATAQWNFKLTDVRLLTVTDEAGYKKNCLEPAQNTIADHDGKLAAGGFNKTT
jgi:hypothetical protein